LVFRPDRNQNSSEQTDDSSIIQHRQEIRGSQMLTAANDAQNMLLLNNELFDALRQLRETLSHVGGDANNTQRAQRDAANKLIEQFDNLLGRNAGTGSNQPSRQNVGGAVGAIQNSINTAILQTLRSINANDQNEAIGENPYEYDMFLKRMPQKIKERLRNFDERHSGLRREQNQANQLAEFNPTAPIRSTSPRARNNGR
jgi:hypothetical protein